MIVSSHLTAVLALLSFAGPNDLYTSNSDGSYAGRSGPHPCEGGCFQSRRDKPQELSNSLQCSCRVCLEVLLRMKAM